MTASKRERVKEAVVKSLAMGASVLAACAGVQIGRSTFYRWLEGDASFEEAVMMARVGLIEEVMSELRLLAFGRYVEEEKIVETASGPRKEWRKRWRDGKVSALMAILKMMEKDLAGMEERRAGREAQVPQMEKIEEVEEVTAKSAEIAKGGRGMVGDGEGECGVSSGVSQVSRNSLGNGAEGANEACDGGEAIRVAAGAGASHIEEQGDAVRLGVSRVSQNSLKNGGEAVVRESRRERRARERQEFKAAKLARKAAAAKG